jgi:NAD(P)-dependent dehydrogenase (short-subunit alcohol dehydrogenase family)
MGAGYMRNTNKTAIVTGGGQGIGKAIAKKLLAKGINVVIAETDEEAGKETEAELKWYSNIKFIKCDISDQADVKSMIEETVKLCGGIDFLINNAATSANKPIIELTLEEWNRVIGVNLTGAFLCSKHCAPYLKERKGSIINMCSTRAFMSEADTEAYSASKGGIYALTHSLAVSLAPEVKVNCISPGWIEVNDFKKSSIRNTPRHSEMDKLQHPAGRVGVPEDIANAVWFLLSQEDSFITGSNFVIDGGMTKKMIYV